MQVNSPEVELPRNIIQVQEEKKICRWFYVLHKPEICCFVNWSLAVLRFLYTY